MSKIKKLIECVPNFSEGRNKEVINELTDKIKKIEGIRLLDVDPGEATNRTVITFVGSPDQVVNAAFNAIKKASELIDMSKHKGAHPRMGATDVCPLIPVSGITMKETVEYARKLAQRVGTELKIPVYCYEYAAFKEQRKNLANIRAGEYEGLLDKIKDPNWKPDFGPAKFNSKSGATVIGARDFLVAYNVNLNTTSAKKATAIAYDVREKGKVKRRGDKINGEIIRNKDGTPIYASGSLKAVKAIGWYIEEYGIAQVSMNLTNTSITPIHIAFEEVCKRANFYGLRVSGSEIVGLVPLKALLDAGRYFLIKQKHSIGVSEEELIKIAIKSLGLNDLYEFKPEDKVIEFVIADKSKKKLIDDSLKKFSENVASESPAPGGGSVSAYVGALGISLGTMVANLSSQKKGWEARWQEFSNWAEKGQIVLKKLIQLVDEDTEAFNKIINAYRLPKSSQKEIEIRKKAIQEATKYAIQVPFEVMKTAYESMEVIKAMAKKGNPNSASDAGVGALCAHTAIRGAFLNVRINAKNLDDKKFIKNIIQEGSGLLKESEKLEKEILGLVENNLI